MSNFDIKQWKAVYTKPRSEKKIAERLEKQGFEVYCPVQTTIRQWSDRKKKVSVPVFPSYVFICVNSLEADGVLQDPGVLNFVYWLGKPAIIRNEEIRNIKLFLSNHKDANIELCNFENGVEVVITAGPLKGQSGIIDRISPKTALLNIASLGITVKVCLNPGDIVKALPSDKLI